MENKEIRIYEAVVIGAGLAGLECANTLFRNDVKNFVILEKRDSILKQNSWKTFRSVIEDFNLYDYYRNRIDGIILRTIDIDKNQILSEKKEEFECYALNSVKIYRKYLETLGEYILTGTKVISINVLNDNSNRLAEQGINQTIYEIRVAHSADNKANKNEADESASNNECVFLTKRIIDASGTAFVTDALLNSENTLKTPGKNSGKNFGKNSRKNLGENSRKNFGEKSRAYYICYAKRYKNCNDSILNNSVIFDFDSAFKFFGSWTYPLGNGEIEIGLAKLSNVDELKDEKARKRILKMHEHYLSMPPFAEILQNAQPVETIEGIISLLPRPEIERSGIYYIGDTKGAVAYSGYGVENALRSGRKAAISIISEIGGINKIKWPQQIKPKRRRKYNFFISSPSKSLAILTLLWNSPPDTIKSISKAVGNMNRKRLQQFYTGDIDLGFFIDATRACIKNKINSLALIKNPGLVFRALLNLKPHSKDYEVFNKS